MPAILLDLVRDPREDREARAEESRRPREQEAEQTIAPRRREVERERPPPLEEEALALRVLALERGDERVCAFTRNVPWTVSASPAAAIGAQIARIFLRVMSA